MTADDLLVVKSATMVRRAEWDRVQMTDPAGTFQQMMHDSRGEVAFVGADYAA